ncbi:MAG: hypothetical protein A2Z18_10685 [Armatimonadetes bacterium RBG_16_58_9]|nr:MAG: hypothetical protein A2Z18_10685 [Armatimonadetes bacterium RBG_16_58_9]
MFISGIIYKTMTTDELQSDNAPEQEPQNGSPEGQVPVGIARIREEWRKAGLDIAEWPPEKRQDIQPVVFSEVDGGAGIGDYVLDRETVRQRLALSEEAIDRLINSGELDSIVVQGCDGEQRRVISRSSVERFQSDSGIDPEAIERAAEAMADATVAEAIRQLQGEIDELRNTQGKVLAQMKDMLLLEVRNLKEQDRDLTSFVYELAEEIRAALSKKKR